MTTARSSKNRLPSLPSTVTTMRGLDLHLLHSLAPPMVPSVPLRLDFWPTRNYDSMTPIAREWDWTRWWILRRGPNSEHCVIAKALPASVMLLPRLPSSASLLRRVAAHPLILHLPELAAVGMLGFVD
jgi:hypothetical protein